MRRSTRPERRAAAPRHGEGALAGMPSQSSHAVTIDIIIRARKMALRAAQGPTA